MLIERTKVKRKKSIMTVLGAFIGSVAKMLDFFADMLQNEIEEKEVKQ